MPHCVCYTQSLMLISVLPSLFPSFWHCYQAAMTLKSSLCQGLLGTSPGFQCCSAKRKWFFSFKEYVDNEYTNGEAKYGRFLLCSLSSIQRKPYLQKNECKKIIWLYHFRCEEPMENDNGWIPENRLTEHHCSTHLFCTESLISGLLLKLYLQYFYTHTPFLPSHHS